MLFFIFLPTCEGKCCCRLKTSKRSCFSLQSLQTSFKWTGASFDSGGAAAVVGRSSLLLIISTTVNLVAVKQDGRPSRRQGQLMMTHDDLRLLTSCHSCPNVKNLQLLDSKGFRKKTSGPEAVNVKYISVCTLHSLFLHLPAPPY